MFTGLIEIQGAIADVRPLAPASSIMRLAISAPHWLHLPMLGESIAVNGCCLTLAAPSGGGLLEFDVVQETLDKTTLGGLRTGDTVHLEASCTPETLLGGHIVQGHVDGVGEVLSTEPSDAYRIRVRPPHHLIEYCVPKGSIAIEGVSLTLADVNAKDCWFEVALIPTTLEKTHLGKLRAGSRINLECDVLSKTVVHWLKNFGSLPGTKV
jgi:riboflavin synthase